jgi:pantoate--beta-alanine ligase
LFAPVARDLFLPTEVVGCKTVRDDDGLALSSRNVRLSSVERRAALVLSPCPADRRRHWWDGARTDPDVVEAVMRKVVADEPLVELDYAVVAQADDLEPASNCSGDGPVRLLVAATVGPVRLIDNMDPGAVPPVPHHLLGPEPAGRISL